MSNMHPTVEHWNVLEFLKLIQFKVCLFMEVIFQSEAILRQIHY